MPIWEEIAIDFFFFSKWDFIFCVMNMPNIFQWGSNEEWTHLINTSKCIHDEIDHNGIKLSIFTWKLPWHFDDKILSTCFAVNYDKSPTFRDTLYQFQALLLTRDKIIQKRHVWSYAWYLKSAAPLLHYLWHIVSAFARYHGKVYSCLSII